MKPRVWLEPFSAKLGARKPLEKVPRKAISLNGCHLKPADGEKLVPKSE